MQIILMEAPKVRTRRRLPLCNRSTIVLAVYEDFFAVDRWTGKRMHCVYQALIVAISTRHADAVDIKFLADGQPVWIALPLAAWAEYKKRTGRVISDPLAVQIAGHYLKDALESGLESGREMLTVGVDEMLQHLDTVIAEHGVRAAEPVPLSPQ